MANDLTLSTLQKSDALFRDSALQSTRFALDGLSERQKVISNNLANVDTPGYKAQNLSFESVLRGVVQKDENLPLVSTHKRHISLQAPTPGVLHGLRTGGSVRADGNNVDIDVELTEISEVGIQYQALTQAASKKLQLLKTIASSR